ncbi:MAG: hypothetical protein EBV06_01095 [Planctomycetia bacterium]|nr:hypothetical protein [Planctomycetia bacterium]
MNINPIATVLAGVVIVVAGSVWLAVALLGRGKGRWPTSLILAGVFALLAPVLLAVDNSLTMAATILAGGSLLITFVRTDAPFWIAKAASRAPVQTSLLCLMGLVLTGYGMYRMDADLYKEMQESDHALDTIAFDIDLGISTGPAARTDLGRLIPLWKPTSDSAEAAHSFSEADYLRRMHFEAHVIQISGLDDDYNCHGWVFTGGKYWVRGAWVETILLDNGYRETKKPAIGDLCIYRDSSGEVSHSAIVCGLGANGMILLESKWGQLGRYIHSANQYHAYATYKPTYYRSKRKTHILQGIEKADDRAGVSVGEE